MEQNVSFKIICIGAGGTGGYFLKEFSRYLNGYLKNIKELIVIDGDIVEEHNLTRQCFQREDIGFPKAVVLADVLASAFDVYWKAYPEYLTSVEQLQGWLNLKAGEIPVLLGCVDNHGARMVMEEFFRCQESCIYFDSANEHESGEVVLSYKLKGKQISRLRSEIFPDLLTGDLRNVTDMSCEELNQVTPQHITVNMMAGLSLLSTVTGLLEQGSIKPGMISFNSFTMTSEYLPLVMEEA